MSGVLCAFICSLRREQAESNGKVGEKRNWFQEVKFKSARLALLRFLQWDYMR
jgi:hypothetical protein